MPRIDASRDDFVARIDHRRRWAYRRARIRRRIAGSRKPLQAEVYDAMFRSDREAVAYHYAVANDHVPDFDAPTWVNEKVRWQFLHHPNPLMSLAADKIAVRDYLRFKGCGIAPPELVAAGHDPGTLLEVDLPRRFALKSAYGSGQNHLEDGFEPTARSALAAKVRAWSDWDQWRHTGEMHYRDVPKRWLVEEYVPSDQGQVEYKFFCMMGEPQFCLVLTDRSGPKYRCRLYDLDWRPLEFHWRGYPPDGRDTPRPADLDRMVAESRRLSEDFLHVRVDFLRCDGRLVFSELTFAGGAARNPFDPLSLNVALGEMMDLSRAPELLARGRSIAAELGWPAASPAQHFVRPACDDERHSPRTILGLLGAPSYASMPRSGRTS